MCSFNASRSSEVRETYSRASSVARSRAHKALILSSRGLFNVFEDEAVWIKPYEEEQHELSSAQQPAHHTGNHVDYLAGRGTN